MTITGFCFLGAGIGCCTQTCSSATIEHPPTPMVNAGDLKGLSDTELLNVLPDVGRTLADSMWIPRLSNRPMSAALIAPTPEHDHFKSVEREIVRRGNRMVPQLIEFLQAELLIVRPEEFREERLDFTRTALLLLVEIGDGSCLPPLLEILSSPDVAKSPPIDARFGQSTPRELGVQRAILEAIAKVTHVRFSGTIEPYFIHNEYCIPATGEWYLGASVPFEALAEQYQRWVDEYGLDRRQWLSRSIAFAREHLDSDDVVRVRVAVTFLQARAADPADRVQPWRDDDPDATLARLVRFVRTLDLPKDEKRQYVTANEPRGWLDALCHYGPLARPHSGLLIDMVRGFGLNDRSGYAQLRRVGGDAVMDFLVECMPAVHAEAERIRNDPETPQMLPGGDIRLKWLSADRDLHAAFDRWAGKRFDTVDQRMQWWRENRQVSEEARFRKNLPVVIEQFENGDIRAGWVLGALIPDCVGEFRRFAATCIRENLDRLEYDATFGVFRVLGRTGGSPGMSPPPQPVLRRLE